MGFSGPLGLKICLRKSLKKVFFHDNNPSNLQLNVGSHEIRKWFSFGNFHMFYKEVLFVEADALFLFDLAFKSGSEIRYFYVVTVM